MRTWFTSDLHLGHRLVAGKRGFGEDTDAHDAALAANWRACVGETDIVWVLGDLTLGRVDAALAPLAALPGRKRLVLGNHDRGHPMHRDAHLFAAAYAAVFELVTHAARTRVLGVEALLSHFPYERDRGAVRHTQWRLPDLGVPLIHGHTHDRERVALSAAGTREVHVGLDAWDLAPVRDEEVRELLQD